VWSDGVVVGAPAFGQHAKLFDRVEDFGVEELVPEFRVERLALAVLPRRAGFDVECLCAGVGEPFPRSFATNSGPLSERRCSGTPFITMISANAAITLDEPIIVSSSAVKSPRFARYGWAGTVTSWFYNSANLPAGTFTSEKWHPQMIEAVN
jgi:hypothetical protein